MTDENWVTGMKPRPPAGPWTVLGWILVIVATCVAPAAVIAGWRVLL